jgi:hypothetical protein
MMTPAVSNCCDSMLYKLNCVAGLPGPKPLKDADEALVFLLGVHIRSGCVFGRLFAGYQAAGW